MMKTKFEHPSPVTFKKISDMPYFTMSEATTEWNQTGTWRYMRPRYVERIPACQHGCPISNDIESWIRFFEKGDIKTAWEAITLESPFPSIMGRVCFHPCMDHCNRKEFGGSVNINMLERALGDAVGKELPVAKPFFPPTKKRIAVIGSGPAGLSCAYHLTRLGHSVTIYDRETKAGGMLRYGIPEYRLPKDILDREIVRLEKMGIQFELGKPIRDAVHLQQIRTDHNAMFIAIGAQHSRSMGVPNEKAVGVMSGLSLLSAAASGKKVELGKCVLVVGGGNTALDAARTARRLGSTVTVLYRRTRAEMPAYEEEINQAIEEGILIEELVAPARVVMQHSRFVGLECLRMELGDPDASGRRKPVPIEDSETIFEADSVLTAIGEEIETDIVPSVLQIENGALSVTEGGRTEWSNVFAGGDFISQPRTVVDAIASGKRSAIAIDCTLRGENIEATLKRVCLENSDAAYMSKYLELRTGKVPASSTTSETSRLDQVVSFCDLNPYYFEKTEPNPTPTLPVSERLTKGSFAEIHTTPQTEVLKSEMSRCFHCGRCTECDNCYIYCPDVSIAKRDCGFDIDYFFCKGCGVCQHECPRAAMQMIEEPTSA